MSRRRRVLVVEDEETLRETIADLVRDDGHEVRTAADGVEALAQADGWAPDLVILDVMLPRMDAFEFRRRQLAAGGQGSRVLLVSAAPNLPGAAQRLRADAWLAKPFSVDALLDAVNDLLNGGGAPPNPTQTRNGSPGPVDGGGRPPDWMQAMNGSLGRGAV